MISVFHNFLSQSGFLKFWGMLLVIIGVLISLTGLGAIIGIPMIILGLLHFFLPVLSFYMFFVLLLYVGYLYETGGLG